MSKFVKNWEAPKEKTPPPSGPLKPHIENAIKLIQTQTQKLDFANARLAEKDKMLFSKIVDAFTKHDRQKAVIYANELAEIRKIEKKLLQIKLALETIALRLTTVRDYGDFLHIITPAMSIVKSIQPGVLRIVPEAEKEFMNLSNSLYNIITEAGAASGLSVSFETANEDAMKILNEAAAVAEQKIKERLPELPEDVTKEGIKI
ncbi:MAG: Snf7 family protein [Candidatus Methanomethyliaceae archaeon]|nr:Snf7 family protein [Candidatus Methanomethyliaceae archaeon]MDW7971123.1 Snf7 family protein [Nitrososphaerota archaeon]